MELKLAGGTRHRDEMWQIIVCILTEFGEENDFEHLQQEAGEMRRHIQKEHCSHSLIKWRYLGDF